MESMNDWTRAEQHAQRAQRYFKRRQWGRALAELRAAVRVNPQQSDWHFGMGLALEALQRHEEALDCFQRVLTLRGEDEQTLEHLGVNLIQLGRCREAVEALAQLTLINPQAEAGYCYRILAHAMLDEHDQAEQMFYMARLLRAECPRCYEHIAQSLAAREMLDKAIWCWQRVLRLEHEHPDANLHLAHLLWQRGQRQRARLHFLEQIHREPHDAQTLLALASLLLEMGQDAEVEEILAQIAVIEEDCAEAYLLAAELALRKGHTLFAARSLERATRLDPRMPGIDLFRALLTMALGKRDAALRHAVRAAHRFDHTARSMALLTDLLLRLRQPGYAQRLACSLLEVGRHDPDAVAAALRMRGAAHLMLGQVDAAVRDLRSSCHHRPCDDAALPLLARALARAGQPRRARAVQRRLRRLGAPLTQRRRLALDLLLDRCRRRLRR